VCGDESADQSVTVLLPVVHRLEATSALGKGRMGEVYRARDLKLKREVAIKILPDEFSWDPDRVNVSNVKRKCWRHSITPTLLQIYSLEESGATRFLVSELVEGENGDRVRRGPIPVHSS
jgi:eukaryotic-like serine/threonine-protein kinase